MFELVRGDSVCLISIPHAGTEVPAGILERFTPSARQLPDTDWFVDRLYRWAPQLGVTLLSANHSRYVIDLNRPPDDTPLYTSATTGLVPTIQFDGQAIYEAQPPGAEEVARRQSQFHAPYHQALQGELDRIRARHGYAVLLDAHSIKSVVPRLFTGRLPDLNLGTYRGSSAAPDLIEAVTRNLAEASGYTLVVDGRFQGGYITRHYGRPDERIHAIQLELAQTTYMDEDRVEYLAQRAESLIERLRSLVQTLLSWRPA